MQFAIKWSTIEAAIKHIVRTRSIDWITAVGGDIRKRDMLIDLVHGEFDRIFNELAGIDDLKITLRPVA
jgi:hypothetical protein